MRNYFTKLCADLEAQVEQIRQQKTNDYLSLAIVIYETGLEKLKSFLDESPFQSEEDEIHFFKVLKPNLLAKLIYYKKIVQIEIEKPQGSIDAKKAHLNAELKRITRYFTATNDFIKYVRSKRTDLDNRYFVRERAKEIPMFESYSCEIDYKYGTGYDYRIAVLLANELLEKDLLEQLELLNTPQSALRVGNFSTCGSTDETSKITWTESQTALVEVIYGLYNQGAFNNGNVDIKEIAACFESAFNIKINQLYRTFSDIKNRKNDRLKFIETMKTQLEQNMDDEYKL